MHPGISDSQLRDVEKEAVTRLQICQHESCQSAPVAPGETALTSRSQSGKQLRLQRPYVKLTALQKDRFVLRRFQVDPIALPPHPCMLCDAAFGAKDVLFQHMHDEHGGENEYRQRLVFLSAQFDAVGAVTPQLWRHATEVRLGCLQPGDMGRHWETVGRFWGDMG